MTDTTPYRAQAEMLAKRTEAGMPEDAAFWLMDLERAVSTRSDRLVEACRSVADQAERVIRYIDQGSTINSLGELQGRGPEMDRRCAELCFAQDALIQAKAYLGRLYPGTLEED